MQQLYTLGLVSESCRQNLLDRTLDLPFLLSSKRTKREFAVLVSGQLCGYICSELLLERISLSAFANRFELRCEQKQLMVLYYKICPCWRCYLTKMVTG